MSASNRVPGHETTLGASLIGEVIILSITKTINREPYVITAVGRLAWFSVTPKETTVVFEHQSPGHFIIENNQPYAVLTEKEIPT